jgi:hypothetical protein
LLLLRLLPVSASVRFAWLRRVFLRPVARSRSLIKCLCCNDPFAPGPRNRTRQLYCLKPACRVASKAAAQAKWVAKPANRDYFKGAHHVDRVRQWRKANPGYSRRTSSRNPPPPEPQSPLHQDPPAAPLQDPLPAPLQDLVPPLQDLVILYPAIVVGLIAVQIGSALQDDIHEHLHRVASKGAEILRQGAGRFPPPS